LGEGWKLNLGEVEAALGAGGRLVVLASPAHPTGRIIPADELRGIARITRKHKAMVMCDERAAHLAAKDLPSALEFLEDRFVCIRTIQNTGGKGQPPFRITYAVNVGVKDEQVRSMFAIAGLNPPALPATAKIIDAFKESSNLAFAREVAQRIDVACSKLDTMHASYYKPEGGLWMFPRINIQGFRATEFVRELLRARMIAVSPGDAFGPYPDHIGLSLTPSPSTLIQGLEKIKEALTVA
ncbi:MAG: aminotransferase class I/II-fold pyridoxal phosphate-dependent enzyme, partial [Candidatus Bathyarchaeia archaeon]